MMWTINHPRQFLIKFLQGIDVDTVCTEYENGTALHIAATNLGVSAVQVLLNFGADPNLTDDLARKAHDCIPEIHAIGHVSHQRLEATKMAARWRC